MEKQDLKQFKETLKKHGHNPPSEDLFEIYKNIQQLADVIIEFEKKKLQKVLSPPKRKKYKT